jgi:hypothetical protein
MPGVVEPVSVCVDDRPNTALSDFDRDAVIFS